MAGFNVAAAFVLFSSALCMCASALRVPQPLWVASTPEMLSVAEGAQSFTANTRSVFVATNTTMMSLDAATGAAVWVQAISLTLPSFAASEAYVVVLDASAMVLYVLDAHTGRLLNSTTFFLPQLVGAQWTPLDDNTFLFADEDSCGFGVVTVPQLQVAWTIYNNSFQCSQSGISADKKKLFFQTSEDMSYPQLSIVDLSSGTFVAVPNIVAVSSWEMNGMLAAFSNMGYVCAVDIHTGSVVWTKTIMGLVGLGLGTQYLLWVTPSTVVVTAVSNFEAEPLYVLDSSSGFLLSQPANWTALGCTSYASQSSFVDGMLVLMAACGDTPQSWLLGVDTNSGAVITLGAVASLGALSSQPTFAPIGNSNVVVPNSMGFVVYSASNFTTPLAYTLSVPGVSALAVMPQAQTFVLVAFNTVQGFSCLV